MNRAIGVEVAEKLIASPSTEPMPMTTARTVTPAAAWSTAAATGRPEPVGRRRGAVTTYPSAPGVTALCPELDGRGGEAVGMKAGELHVEVTRRQAA